MAWREERIVNKENIHLSAYHIIWSGAQIEFEIKCLFSGGEWRWMLYSEQFGISDNLLGIQSHISKDECKLAALRIIKQSLSNMTLEVDLQLPGYGKEVHYAPYVRRE